MKKPVTVIEKQCDFCEEKADQTCSICGQDICYKHTVSVSIRPPLEITKDSAKNFEGILSFFATYINNCEFRLCPNDINVNLLELIKKVPKK